MNPEVVTTAARGAKHATRALATIVSLYQKQLSTQDVEVLARELREILISTRQALHAIENAAPETATASNLRDAQQSAGDAARSLAHVH